MKQTIEEKSLHTPPLSMAHKMKKNSFDGKKSALMRKDEGKKNFILWQFFIIPHT